MSAKRIVALVSRRCEPIDGVSDYCECLGAAVASHGYAFETFCVNWQGRGWRAALADLKDKATAWRGSWVLLQYTAFGWSRRGFPVRAPSILSVLQQSGARCGVVFHEFEPAIGKRMIDRARRYCQRRVLENLFKRAECAVFTVPLEKVSWRPTPDKAVFIPVGANCPDTPLNLRTSSEVKTVAVYCITGGKQMIAEVADIGHALKRARATVGRVRLIFFGTGAREADAALRAEFAGSGVDMEMLGLLSPEDVSRNLARADVMLFVRGQISGRRGSAMAGIASGLPVVCYEGPETSWPITEAGLFPVPLGDREALSDALRKVLSDATLRDELSRRSRRAQEEYFCWRAIASRYADALEKPDRGPEGSMEAGPL
jgi:Glycosyl transferases group 1